MLLRNQPRRYYLLFDAIRTWVAGCFGEGIGHKKAPEIAEALNVFTTE